MVEQSCIFCKIIQKQLPARIIAENDSVIVIQDIAPQAPVHYLIIPKNHVENIKKLRKEDHSVMAEIMLMAQELSKSLPANGDFRLLSNNGATAGQKVFHLHFHFLSGKIMVDF